MGRRRSGGDATASLSCMGGRWVARRWLTCTSLSRRRGAARRGERGLINHFRPVRQQAKNVLGPMGGARQRSAKSAMLRAHRRLREAVPPGPCGAIARFVCPRGSFICCEPFSKIAGFHSRRRVLPVCACVWPTGKGGSIRRRRAERTNHGPRSDIRCRPETVISIGPGGVLRLNGCPSSAEPYSVSSAAPKYNLVWKWALWSCRCRCP